ALRFTVRRMRDFFLNPVDDPLRVNKDFREFYERLRILRRERDGGMEGLLMAMATGYDYRKYQKVKALEKKGTKKPAARREDKQAHHQGPPRRPLRVLPAPHRPGRGTPIPPVQPPPPSRPGVLHVAAPGHAAPR